MPSSISKFSNDRLLSLSIAIIRLRSRHFECVWYWHSVHCHRTPLMAVDCGSRLLTSVCCWQRQWERECSNACKHGGWSQKSSIARCLNLVDVVGLQTPSTA